MPFAVSCTVVLGFVFLIPARWRRRPAATAPRTFELAALQRAAHRIGSADAAAATADGANRAAAAQHRGRPVAGCRRRGSGPVSIRRGARGVPLPGGTDRCSRRRRRPSTPAFASSNALFDADPRCTKRPRTLAARRAAGARAHRALRPAAAGQRRVLCRRRAAGASRSARRHRRRSRGAPATRSTRASREGTALPAEPPRSKRRSCSGGRTRTSCEPIARRRWRGCAILTGQPLRDGDVLPLPDVAETVARAQQASARCAVASRVRAVRAHPRPSRQAGGPDDGAGAPSRLGRLARSRYGLPGLNFIESEWEVYGFGGVRVAVEGVDLGRCRARARGAGDRPADRRGGRGRLRPGACSSRRPSTARRSIGCSTR